MAKRERSTDNQNRKRKENSSKLIEAWCQAYAEFMTGIYHGESQPPVWPIPLSEIAWHLGRHFLPELQRTIKALQEKGIDEKRVARLFQGSFPISHYLGCMNVMAFSGLKPAERVELMENLLDYLACYRRTDLFCENGKNILWEKKKVETVLKDARLTQADDKKRQLMGSLNGRLYLLSDHLHGIYHCSGYEYHGPYPLPNDGVLLVRDYFGIRLPEVWPFTENLSFERVSTLEIYKDVEIKVDFNGHLWSSSSLPSKLQRYSILVNGRQAKNLARLSGNLDGVLQESTGYWTTMSDEDWAKKFVELHFYYLKPHKDTLGLDWKPPKAVYRTIETEEINPRYLEAMKELSQVAQMPRKEGVETLKNFYLKSIYDHC